MRGVDRRGELLEGMPRTDDEHPARQRIADDPAATDKLNLDPQPRSGHRPCSLTRPRTAFRESF
jgi:hypothetical protein